MTDPLGVLVVDDEPLVRAGLRAIIDAEADLVVVGEAADGAGAVSLVGSLVAGAREGGRSSAQGVDVVCMDVRMPRVDGIAATRLLLSRWPNGPKVLVLTTFENDEYVYEALAAGAHGFLLKRATPDQLVSAIRTVHAGDTLLLPDAVRRLVGRFGRAAGAARPHMPELTERESEVLRAMARGWSNAEIATGLVVSVETVKTHVANVLAKLGVRDRTQAVVLAYRSGFVDT